MTLVEVDAHLNDDVFAAEVAARLLECIGGGSRGR
jgi:hypothetical protein